MSPALRGLFHSASSRRYALAQSLAHKSGRSDADTQEVLMAAVRIGRIRMKAGGAEVRILERPKRQDGSNWTGDIIRHATVVAGYDAPDSELVGFFMIGLFSDGTRSSGFRWDAKRSPIPRHLMPAYVAEIIREDLITEGAACDVVNRANGWTDE